MLKEMDAILDSVKLQPGNNDDSHSEEEDMMVDGNIPVSPNSGTVVGDGASGTPIAAGDEGMTFRSNYISLLSS